MRCLILIVFTLLAAFPRSAEDLKTRNGKVYQGYMGLAGADPGGIVVLYGNMEKATVDPKDFPSDFKDKALVEKLARQIPDLQKEQTAAKKEADAKKKADAERLKKRAQALKSAKKIQEDAEKDTMKYYRSGGSKKSSSKKFD